MRRTLASLILLCACGGGGKDGGPTGPAPVANVSLTVQLTSLTVGQSTTITASLTDAQGNSLTGRTITWTSSAPTVASVTSAGLVTGLAVGQATITAASEGKSAQTTITVTASGPSCTGATPLNVAIGEVHTLTTAERQLLCLSGGANGTEYVLIPFNSSTVAAPVPLTATASGTIATVNPPLAASAQLRGARGLEALPALRAPSGASGGYGRAFEQRLRELEKAELEPRLRAGPRGPSLLRALRAAPGTRLNVKGLAANPAVGSTVTLNANSTSACGPVATNRFARVAAVSNNAIVVVDTLAPAGGFSDAEYLGIATTFDTLVFPLDTAAFGAPFDMDGNGRVVLFFTSAVNQLTPAGNAGGYIGGFFFARDLFTAAGVPQAPFQCATSNEGEMFYLPVLDPNSQFNGFFKVKSVLQTEVISTLAHEFQHLINASRRIYVQPADVDFEEVWLNEGMSHIAEELLYFHVAGFAPKQDLTYQAVVATPAKLSAINAYQVDNLGRLNSYLAATDVNAPFAQNDSLATRGAIWQLLRWALDQSPNATSTYLKALVDATTVGKPNFDNVFAGVGGLLGATRSQVIANFFDNTTVAIATQYAHPSWNFRDLLPHLTGNPPRFPLSPKSLVPGASQSYNLVGGGSGYLRFRVTGGAVGGVTATSAGGALPATVELILVRTS